MTNLCRRNIPTIAINVNGQDYPESGIIIMDNAFVPIDLADRLGLELADLTDVRRVTYWQCGLYQSG